MTSYAENQRRFTKPMLGSLLVLLALLGIGCAKVISSQELVRVDEGMQYTTRNTLRRARLHEYTLPEKRFVGKIVIHTTGEVKQLEIFAQRGKDYWKSIRRVRAGTSSPIEIRTAVSTDAIRIVQSVSFRGEIQRIELYGTPATVAMN